MAMEYLEGMDLHQMVKQKGALNHDKVIGWMAPVAGALHYIHQKGLVHRDIKSSNIIITKEGRPVLMDFGIAHAADGTKLTQTGTVIGTPEYMSQRRQPAYHHSPGDLRRTAKPRLFEPHSSRLAGIGGTETAGERTN